MKNWYSNIQDELDKRTAKCKLRYGLQDEYVLPSISPFSYPTVEMFCRHHPFSVSRKNCKFPTKRVANTLNTLQNAYIRATNKTNCTKMGGVWDPDGINREDNYRTGVCWASTEDKTCANAVDPIVLRPNELKRATSTDKNNHINIARQSCENAHCHFEQLGQNSFDCLRKEISHRDEVNAAKLETTGNKCQLVSTQIQDNDTLSPTIKEMKDIQQQILAVKNSNQAEKVKYLTTPELFAKFKSQQFTNCQIYFPDVFKSWPEHINNLSDIPLKSQKHLVSQGQLSVYNIVKKNMPQRGLLIWHSTGSGKTCIASGIMTVFWNTPRDIYYVTSLGALASNSEAAFATCATMYWPNFTNNNQFFGRVKFITYTKLINRICKCPPEVNLNNSVLIMDEIQNLFAPIATQRQQHKRLLRELKDPKKWPNLKVFILTATPGNNISQLLHLLNFVRDPSVDTITAPNNTTESEDIFCEQIKTLVSYFDMSNDKSAFPTLIDNDFLRLPMSQTQFRAYNEKLAKVKEQKFDDNKVNDYFKSPRKYSNMLANLAPNQPLEEFSAKLPSLINNILKYPKDKHFVFSSFWENRYYGGHGIRAIAMQLENAGYSQILRARSGSHKKRFILAIDGGDSFSELVNLFNSKQNAHGEIIHVFLASKTFNEGLDLKDIRHIHVFEPLVTWAADKQLIGRAVRYCSHANLDQRTEWTVNVHRYMSAKPEGEIFSFVPAEMRVADLKSALLSAGVYIPPKTKKDQLQKLLEHVPASEDDIAKLEMIDDKIYREANLRVKKLTRIYQLVKESAIDCPLFSKYHQITCRSAPRRPERAERA